MYIDQSLAALALLTFWTWKSCVVGCPVPCRCRAASLASAHQMPVAPTPSCVLVVTFKSHAGENNQMSKFRWSPPVDFFFC